MAFRAMLKEQEYLAGQKSLALVWGKGDNNLNPWERPIFETNPSIKIFFMCPID
jgi:hypothetical protein